MSEKKNFRLKDEKFNVFIPLVNLLLFDKFESPDFDSGNAKLSEDFIESVKSIRKVDIEQNEFLKTRILKFLSDLDFSKRDFIFQIILENIAYFQSVLFAYVIDNNLSINKETIDQAQIKLLGEFGDFRFEGKLVKEIYFYFIFHFEDILFFEFANNSYVLKSEYLEIIQNICIEKDFINLGNF